MLASGWFINAITLARFIVKNIIEQTKIVRSAQRINGKGITLMHWTKIIIEAVLMVLLFVFCAEAMYKATGLVGFGKVAAIVVLLVTLFENAWSIIERLFDATPKPLLY